MIFKWIKSLFSKKVPLETVDVHFRYSDGKEVKTECYKIEYKPNLFCKIHRSYIPVRPPETDCEKCWEIYKVKT